MEMKKTNSLLIAGGVKPVQKLSAEAIKALESANNNGSGGHCQGGGDGNW